MLEQATAVHVVGEVTGAPSHDLPPAEQRVVEELIAEHLRASCEVVLIDEHTWAIHGSIAYQGEAILAEFDTREVAELALQVLAASSPDITVRPTRTGLRKDGSS